VCVHACSGTVGGACAFYKINIKIIAELILNVLIQLALYINITKINADISRFSPININKVGMKYF